MVLVWSLSIQTVSILNCKMQSVKERVQVPFKRKRKKMKKKILCIDWMAGFHCIGGECPMTCCAGWNINITPNEVLQYKELAKSHPFGEKILEALDEEKGSMKLCNGRCMLLTEDDWCKIVLECGEEYLSSVCTSFPRVVYPFGDMLECYVEIGCPPVAKKLFEKNKITFILDELDDENLQDQEQEMDIQLYDMLSLTRSHLIDIFQGYDATYSAVKSYILFSAIRAIQEMCENNQMNENRVRQWMERWDDQNCHVVFQSLEPITKRMDLRAVKILELLNKLLFSEALDFMTAAVKGNALKEDYHCWIQDSKKFGEELQEFTAYFSEHYSFVFENYFVYVLFAEWIPKNLKMDQFGKKFFIRVISWCVIQLCAMSAWKRKGSVSVDEYSLIICGVERMCAHNSQFWGEMAEILAEEDNLAMTLLYLIC